MSSQKTTQASKPSELSNSQACSSQYQISNTFQILGSVPKPKIKFQIQYKRPLKPVKPFDICPPKPYQISKTSKSINFKKAVETGSGKIAYQQSISKPKKFNTI